MGGNFFFPALPLGLKSEVLETRMTISPDFLIQFFKFLEGYRSGAGLEWSESWSGLDCACGLDWSPPSMTATHCPCQSNAWFGAVEQSLDVILRGANAPSPEGEDE